MIGEIKEIFAIEKDVETLKILKRNIIRVLILMSKDKTFILLMKNINSLEDFIFLLKSDLKLCEERLTNSNTDQDNIIINLLPNFIKLVLSILKNYELSHFEVKINSQVSALMTVNEASKNIKF